VACIASLRDEGIEPALFWYNPNIHPFTEYSRRRDTVVQYAGSLDLALIMEDDYGLRQFIHTLDKEQAGFDFPHRCSCCYRTRMEKTALAAKENNFDSFCTTLFISPYQNHELLKEEAETAAEKHSIPLLYRDFRPRFREGREAAKTLELYMQKYCGCIFSEEERYKLQFSAEPVI
jgi:predicted adenine nucleotide alpha hydrolase (AANH) superfamily ATPase